MLFPGKIGFVISLYLWSMTLTALPAQCDSQKINWDKMAADQNEDHQQMMPLWHAIVSRLPLLYKSNKDGAVFAYLQHKSGDKAISPTAFDEFYLKTLWSLNSKGPGLFRGCSISEDFMTLTPIARAADELRVAFHDYKDSLTQSAKLSRESLPNPSQRVLLNKLASDSRKKLVELAGEKPVADLDVQLGAQHE